MKLNLGCGKDRKEGYTNADIIQTEATDVVFDMNEFPYPFADNTADEIVLWSVLEHLRDLTPVMEELWRISKDGCKLVIGVPHFSSLGATVDPTHKLLFSYYSFDYYCKTGHFKEKKVFDYYTEARFKMIHRKIVYPKNLKLLEDFANKFPRQHELYWRKLLPAKSIYFTLGAVK